MSLTTGFRNAVRNAEEALGPGPENNQRLANRAFHNDGAGNDDDVEHGEVDPLIWIPKKLVTEWKNKDGIKCLTLIFQLTGGVASNDNNGVEVKVSNNGGEFAISEEWSPLMSDIGDFYTSLQKAHDETDDDFNRRKISMEDTVGTLLDDNGGSLTSVYRMPLPFRVDPTVQRVRILGDDKGTRFAHVDLTERKKVSVEKVIMLSSKKLHPTSSEKKRAYSKLN
jgi:hypothetical protein